PPKKSSVASGYFSFSPRSSGVVSTKLPTLSEPKIARCGRAPSAWLVKRCICLMWDCRLSSGGSLYTLQRLDLGAGGVWGGKPPQDIPFPVHGGGAGAARPPPQNI